MPLGFVFGKFVSLLFTTIFSWILAQVFKLRSINYAKALQINLHAVTVPTIIMSLFEAIGVNPPIPFFQGIILMIFNGIVFASLRER